MDEQETDSDLGVEYLAMDFHDLSAARASIVMLIAFSAGCADDGATNDDDSTSTSSSSGSSSGSADAADDGGPTGDGGSSTGSSDPESSGGSSSGGVDGTTGSSEGGTGTTEPTSGSSESSGSSGSSESSTDATQGDSDSGSSESSAGTTGPEELCDPAPLDTTCTECTKSLCCDELEMCAADDVCICAVLCITNFPDNDLGTALPTCLNGCGAQEIPLDLGTTLTCMLVECPDNCPSPA